MTGPTGLIPLFFILHLIPVTGPNQGEGKNLICSDSLPATVGEDVTLGCHESRPKELDVTDKSVEWKLNGTIKVLVYRSKGVNTADPAKQFKGRVFTNISSWKPDEGKLNVTISSVEETDAGEYTCSVGIGSKRISCSTTLHVYKSESEKQAFIGQRRESMTTVNQAPNSMPVVETKRRDKRENIGYHVFKTIQIIIAIGVPAAAVVYLLYH